jgi:hypothetical protein
LPLNSLKLPTVAIIPPSHHHANRKLLKNMIPAKYVFLNYRSNENSSRCNRMKDMSDPTTSPASVMSQSSVAQSLVCAGE